MIRATLPCVELSKQKHSKFKKSRAAGAALFSRFFFTEQLDKVGDIFLQNYISQQGHCADETGMLITVRRRTEKDVDSRPHLPLVQFDDVNASWFSRSRISACLQLPLELNTSVFFWL